jgi:hypothetical protein
MDANPHFPVLPADIGVASAGIGAFKDFPPHRSQL